MLKVPKCQNEDNVDFKIRNELIETLLQQIGGAIGRGIPEGYGFSLQIFKFDGPEFFYLSNAERGSLMSVLKEWIAKEEKRNETHIPTPRSRN